ncbi:MAG: hypothetical protein IPK72_18950 [Candidatus Eisenbacteria bacterium]|nr:hypothetical protein [Candidatus Eisenbacteria bacterium]
MPLVIAKIEKPAALDHLDEIIAVSDGVMVARGDLGVELSLERVPIWQKEILERARRAGVFGITATQMLESMVASATPTRAEVSDVANAIYDGTDAVMLSGENRQRPVPNRIGSHARPHRPGGRAAPRPRLVRPEAFRAQPGRLRSSPGLRHGRGRQGARRTRARQENRGLHAHRQYRASSRFAPSHGGDHRAHPNH